MNPLFQSIVQQKQIDKDGSKKVSNMSQTMNQNDMMNRLRSNSIEMTRQAGYEVPEELNGNPQAIVQHLLQTGQIRSPMMQRIQPMLRMLGIR